MSKSVKKWSIITLGLFLLAAVNVWGQDPTGPITLDKNGYYQHGYPGGPDNPREARDSVMVGSTMRYFIMPDKFYNKDYYDTNGGDYTKTNLTKSQFAWTVPSTGTFGAFQNANITNTSPYVTITWNTPSAVTPVDTIRMTETPKEYNGIAIPTGAVCVGTEAKIPVTVIPKPSVMFGDVSGSKTVAQCAAIVTGDETTYPVYNFPLVPASTESGAVISKANGVVVTYTITKDGTEGSDITEKFVSANTATAQLALKFSGYGTYVITIKSITDRIAVKCGVTGDNISSTPANNQFTYMVLPQPKPGPTYHIPNK